MHEKTDYLVEKFDSRTLWDAFGIYEDCHGSAMPPPSIEAENGSIAALKRHTHDFAHQQMTCDNRQISYLESMDTYEYDTLAISRMIVQ
jgi:hypothetical protein